ncbi:uncharacterized protein LOC132061208 [Lycium ferocissimum]|uniref:uncharacterized protein LOC132061208 n=1 Tax=Lycium ferocissimum TaxID=112874 RepID=UPI002814E573|nr:uncharacterized protein LOC132061208 [Lycium ferocissimum]
MIIENHPHDSTDNKELIVADLKGDSIEDQSDQHDSATQSDNENASDKRGSLKVRRKLIFDNDDSVNDTDIINSKNLSPRGTSILQSDKPGFSSSQFTWYNNWGHPKTIWKRLDRILFNEDWLDSFNETKVTHLSRIDFIKVVKDVWSMPTEGTAMWKLHCKMKTLSSRLSDWSRIAFGDIFKDAKEAENHINTLEQRAKAKWLQDGDKNTSYFQKVIKDRKRKLNIQNILDKEGHKFSGHQQVAEAAIEHFEEQFRYQECAGSYDILDHIPNMITKEMNANLIAKPSTQEIRNAVKNRAPDSAPSPDGLGAKFYQCPQPQSFSDIRPISLCNILSRLIAKILNNRISNVLPVIISPNHSGFIQGIFLNIWYTIVLNGARNGFFKSSRGLRQGDPLSPALFIICADLLSRLLNNLANDVNYYGYHRPLRGNNITHLAFTDDVILFTSVSPKENIELKYRVANLTGMQRKEWPIKYLGCPLFVNRMKIVYFSEMVHSITKRIHSWHAKFLSMGGMIILIKHISLAMPVHLLAAIKPPKGTFEQLEGPIARFL